MHFFIFTFSGEIKVLIVQMGNHCGQFEFECEHDSIRMRVFGYSGVQKF